MNLIDEAELEKGEFVISWHDLCADDLQRILVKMSSSRQRFPRKCQRFEGVQKLLSQLPPKTLIRRLDLLGNGRIGDAGMMHLHLLPASITELDISRCGLTAIGCKLLCEMLKKNHSITQIYMWGNDIGDDGASHLRDMLKENRTLRSLAISLCAISPAGFSYLSEGLEHNDTLRTISTGDLHDVCDEYAKNICPGLKLNKGLEDIDLLFNQKDFTSKVVEYLADVAEHNLFLKEVGASLQKVLDNPEVPRSEFLVSLCRNLELNKHSRKIISEEGSTDRDWIEAIAGCADDGYIEGIYFFLRMKPELCARADITWFDDA
jgi:hypothetical protein